MTEEIMKLKNIADKYIKLNKIMFANVLLFQETKKLNTIHTKKQYIKYK